MKRTNVFVFVICFIIIILGMTSIGFAGGVASSLMNFADEVSGIGFFAAADNFTANMEKACTDKLSYHAAFMDINSLLLRAGNVRVVDKDDITVVRSNTDYLANPRAFMETSQLEMRADALKELQIAAEESGAAFAYITAPTKGYAMQYPENVEDFTRSNCDRFFKCLEDRNIPHLNLISEMKEEGYSEEDVFFVTDHHWKPDYAFKATWQICGFLEDNHGFKYDKSVTDISNYSVTTYKDWFLGSQGKKVGKYFTPLGTDDINIILPKFDTHLTESQPAKGTVRDGSFDKTVMYMENVMKKDYYNLNPYAAYSGGDFREQIITNHSNPGGARILLIRDSFSCAMSPFLSLAASELYCIDVREGADYVGDKINAYEYIERIKPDYVLVMYTGVSSGDDLFHFN